MVMLIENSGAQKGFLLLEREGKLLVEASAEVGTKVSVLQSTPLENMSNLSKAIVNYVARTYEPIVMQNAAMDSLFPNDSYIREHQVKSLLCIPILNQGKHIGILYMENNSAAGTFTPIRLQILSILSAQAAISIENARLYNEMELKVKERTLELEKTNRELHSMNEELTRMETSRRHLLTNISHDLRTPMTLIQGYVEGILEGVIDDPEKQKKYLTMIYTKIIALNHLITDLFHLTTLEARKVSLAIQPITIKNLMQHVSNRFELDMLNAGLQFEAQLICMLPNDEIYCVGIDLNRIDQVFYNLIFNSMRYTSEGGAIRISFEVTQSVAEEAEACTGLNSAGDELQITVKDTGVGISEEDISFIFDRFYKGNKSRNMQEEGSGLGLAISKEIIESHGGRIWVESKRNEGSAFSFTLPLQGIV